ncbi:putative acyl esterase [Novosphingobium capsulatum]|uniref:Acyl esterase n=1 Tax=Novosphingobium capsulatum TaxID=13688 RepID=A0ABU1MP00_9SPHN|nr:CocE/NonD family hydrolase [Novosphingobium capsulatum]MDR6512049.1 putative acyl esterase [Novosphingobium capsulatum]
MVAPAFAPLMRPGKDPHSAPGKPPLPPRDHAIEHDAGLVIERNVAIPLRDGVRIFADIYRPAGTAGLADLPCLLSWSPYGKHARSNRVFWPHSGVDPAWLSPLTPFEGADPLAWCPRGYAVAVVDPRGAWLSEGDFHHNGAVEAQDCADTIAWLAEQPWSNGKIGMTGVSYLAAIQFWVAALAPPALAAINPWEGFTDWYREFAYHGGILETGFLPRASDNIAYSLGQTEDTWANAQAHPLHDAFWQGKEIDLGAIRTPAWVVASWSDQGLHTRGTLEAFKAMASPQKWLTVHGQKKWANYYRPESQAGREAFFDHFLLGRATSLAAWPRVRIEVRDRHDIAEWRDEAEWPLARIEPTPLWLGADGGLHLAAPHAAGKTAYDAQTGSAVFEHRFAQDTEITGHASLRLWVEAEGADDMDLFVALQKHDATGAPVGQTFYAFFEDGPVALGWLRASHRATDPQRSTPLQPFHPHTAEQRLRPGEIVPVDIEIWPSSTRFAAGESLRLVIQGRDIPDKGLPGLPFARHEQTRNAERHVLHLGAAHPSHLLLPVVPARED